MAKRSTPATIFLSIVAVLAVVIGITVYAWNFYPWYFMQLTMVPSQDIADDPMPPAPDYTSADAWYAFGKDKGEAAMQPAGYDPGEVVEGVDIFFVHPTTYLQRAHWNAPLGNEDVDYRTRWYVMKNLVSAFNGVDRIYAPKYRQATFGAFLDTTGQGATALQRAHGDVRTAFETYLTQYNEGRPFILVGHSQGALQSLFLLAGRIAGQPVADQMVAAYLVGWPVGVKSDIPAFQGMAPCETATDTGCLISWQSFIGPEFQGEPQQLVTAFQNAPSLTGAPRDGDVMLCTNPLDWSVGSIGASSSNIGAVGAIESTDPLTGVLPQFIGAGCDETGILILERDPQDEPWTNARLPGKNMHVHDVNLFYLNVRDNVRTRAQAFLNKANSR